MTQDKKNYIVGYRTNLLKLLMFVLISYYKKNIENKFKGLKPSKGECC